MVVEDQYFFQELQIYSGYHNAENKSKSIWRNHQKSYSSKLNPQGILHLLCSLGSDVDIPMKSGCSISSVIVKYIYIYLTELK